VAADTTSGCEMTFSAGRRQIRGIVVRPDEWKSPCAGRDWLEGVVLRRQGGG